MVAMCRNLISSSRHYRQVLSNQIDPVLYSRDEEFMTPPAVKSNLFILSLFTRVSDHGIIYSSPANFRPALGAALENRALFGTSLVDQVNFSMDESIFASNAMCVLFYQERSLKEGDTHSYDGCHLTSIAKENLKIGSTLIKEVSIKFRKVGVFPSQNQLLKLAYILNVKVAPPSDVTASRPKLLDFQSILQEFHDFKPISNEALSQFVKRKLKWKFFDIHMKKRLCVNMRRVRSFFQCLQPIGLAFIEGNHRALLASKVLYGENVNACYPIKPADLWGTTVPASSPIFYTNLDVKIMIPETSRMTSLRLISRKMLVSCQRRSSLVASQKQYVIKETWKYFMDTTVARFQRDTDFQPVLIEDFLKIVMPTTRKERLVWHKRENIHYLDMCFKTIEILVLAMLNTPPSMEIAQKSSVGQQKLLLEMCQKGDRLGFGPRCMCQTTLDYKEDGLTERKFLQSAPFRDAWPNSFIPGVLAELFLRVAPFQGGLETLAGYAKADARYLEPGFIAAVVLNPVTQIMETIMEISDKQNIWCDSVSNKQEKVKNRKKLENLLKFWYTMRYLDTLIYFQTPWDGLDTLGGLISITSLINSETDISAKIKKELGTTTLANTIAESGNAPMALYNLPKEFKRWKNHFMEQNCNITDTTETCRRRYWLWNEAGQRPYFNAAGLYYDVENSVENKSDDESKDDDDREMDSDDSDNDSDFLKDSEYTEEDDSFLDDTSSREIEVDEVFECATELKDPPPPVEQNDIPKGISWFVPFDVSLPLHPSIVAAAQHKYDPAWTTFENHTSWDPFYLTQGVVNGVFDFGIQHFYQGDNEKKSKKRKLEKNNEAMSNGDEIETSKRKLDDDADEKDEITAESVQLLGDGKNEETRNDSSTRSILANNGINLMESSMETPGKEITGNSVQIPALGYAEIQTKTYHRVGFLEPVVTDSLRLPQMTIQKDDSHKETAIVPGHVIRSHGTTDFAARMASLEMMSEAQDENETKITGTEDNTNTEKGNKSYTAGTEELDEMILGVSEQQEDETLDCISARFNQDADIQDLSSCVHTSQVNHKQIFNVIRQTILKNFEFLSLTEHDAQTMMVIEGLNKILNYKACLGDDAVIPGDQEAKPVINIDHLKNGGLLSEMTEDGPVEYPL